MRLKYNILGPSLLVILIPLILGGIGFRKSANQAPEKGKNALVVEGKKGSYKHPIAFYDSDLVGKGITSAEQKTATRDYEIKGALVPHHTFATHLIAEVFSCLALQNPESIILIGPNHYERGGFNVLSSEHPWLTPFGDLAAHPDWVMMLEMQGLIRQQPEVLSQDHAVSAIMPYLKYYVPQTKVLPLLLSAHTTSDEIDRLSQALHALQQPKTVVVAAVDFSHYLSSAQAQHKDKETWQIMTQFNFEQLMRLNNQHVDSPASIALLLKLMQLAGSTQSELLANTNSGELTGEVNSPTTSYFTALYH